jgi:FkbM family methyltransferase
MLNLATPIKAAISRIIAATPLGSWPVRVRAGRAKGARWTLHPFSSYWRAGEDGIDILDAAKYLPFIQGAVFWDIGAHFGIHTVGMAMSVGLRGAVYGFEPDPIAWRKLQRHVRMNKLANVEIFELAASDVSGGATLYSPPGGISALSQFMISGVPMTSFSVQTVRLDDMVAAGKLRLPNMIKIDVEGHGDAVLRGAVAAIKLARPIISLSTHTTQEIDGARAALEPLGYYPTRDGKPIEWSAIASFTTLLPAPIKADPN